MSLKQYLSENELISFKKIFKIILNLSEFLIIFKKE